MDCVLPGSSVHGVLQARVLEWVAISFSRGSSRPRDRTRVSCTAGRFFTDWSTRDISTFIVLLDYLRVHFMRVATTGYDIYRCLLSSWDNSSNLEVGSVNICWRNESLETMPLLLLEMNPWEEQPNPVAITTLSSRGCCLGEKVFPWDQVCFRVSPLH